MEAIEIWKEETAKLKAVRIAFLILCSALFMMKERFPEKIAPQENYLIGKISFQEDNFLDNVIHNAAHA